MYFIREDSNRRVSPLSLVLQLGRKLDFGTYSVHTVMRSENRIRIRTDGRPAAGRADRQQSVLPYLMCLFLTRRVNESHFKGDMAEVIVYDRALSKQEMKSVERYLQKRFRLAGK